MTRGKDRKYRYFSCDFETTVYDGQKDTEVWASAVVELGTEDVKILHSIGETLQYFKSLKCNMICYYHNLKFDGNFWLYYLMHDLGWKQATHKEADGTIDWDDRWHLLNNEFEYMISDEGQWYTITMKVNNYIIQLRDSLKLLPFSVKAIGKAFQTKHQKLNMEYKGLRYAGCEITTEEQKYIANDVLVVKEALEIMFSQGHNKMTIGSCCMAEYKVLTGQYQYDSWFPNVYDIHIDKDLHGEDNAGDWIRHSYKGGWCYLVKGKENRIYTNGTVADVNSLYPSMMSSESGNRYPVGNPHFWAGNFIPEEAQAEDRYYFIRFRTKFYLKENMLPFIQIKGSWLYKGTEMLTTSDVLNPKDGKYYDKYYDKNGKLYDTTVTLTLTCIDYKLFREHYDVKDFEILDGCWFDTDIGIFDSYVDKYKEIKMNSKGAMRTLAKLFLNNLYGKMATNTNSSFKMAYIKEDGSIGFDTIEQNHKKPGYIPVGSAITSYARNFTIRAAQANYYGPENDGFIYADTDSIHCDLPADKINGIKVDDRAFCCWKLESSWDRAVFVRQKTYAEHVTMENLEPIADPYWNIKCAGMPERCKKIYLKEHEGRELEDFHVGLKVHGKLVPKRIRGGVLLVETDYEMR